MKLSKSFTTVTPFSKALALSMFIIFPILAFFWGMNYQKLVDMNKPAPVQIEYKFVQPTPSPVVPQNVNNSSQCNTNNDCPAGYYCARSGPIVYNPEANKNLPPKTCHKNGTVVPF